MAVRGKVGGNARSSTGFPASICIPGHFGHSGRGGRGGYGNAKLVRNHVQMLTIAGLMIVSMAIVAVSTNVLEFVGNMSALDMRSDSSLQAGYELHSDTILTELGLHLQ